MYSSVKKYTRNMSSTSPVICSHFCYPTMFAKVCFGFSPLDVSLIEKGLALQFILGTNMKAEIGYQRRFSSNKGNPYPAKDKALAENQRLERELCQLLGEPMLDSDGVHLLFIPAAFYIWDGSIVSPFGGSERPYHSM
jgi:hypothetical protein